MVCSAGTGGLATDRESRFGVTPLAASCRGGGNRGVRRADCRSASGVARRATLTRGCAEARLADLAHEPFAQCSPWDLAVAMVWQAAGAKNADAARPFARGPIPADRSHRRAHSAAVRPLQRESEHLLP